MKRLALLKYNTEQLESFIKQALSSHKDYSEVINLVKNNSEGRIWLVGGSVYKALINKLYGSNLTSKDWDFVVEKIKKPLNLSADVVLGESRLGSPKIKKGEIVLDLMALDNIRSTKERRLKPALEHYLSGVPLTIHSVAYDIFSEKLLGVVGIQSILNKTIRINNKDEYENCVRIYGDSYFLDHFIKVKALGFRRLL